MKNKIKEKLNKLGLFSTKSEKKLLELEIELRVADIIDNNMKVLFTHSLSIYEPSFYHDKLMAFALNLRGFEVFSSFCDGVQDIECNVWGGVWGGGNKFKANCQSCQDKSAKLWSFLNKENIYRYSKYLTEEDYKDVEDKLINIPYDQWSYYNEAGWDIGCWAKDILVNNYVVADYKLIENHEVLGRVHLKNLLLSKIASGRIIKDLNPDRIISNDSYYGMWKMWELLAKENNIPFYSHWSGTRVGGWCYAYGDASMRLDFSKSWKSYSKIDLRRDEKQRVEDWLQNRISGKDMLVDTASLSSFKNEEFNLEKIDSSKPVALLSANVVWDLAALNKEVFSDNMADWIIKTINWFGLHPEFQLIIKPHPAEFHPDIPNTKETVTLMIEKKFIKVPDNVFILSPKVSITVYDLFSISKVGLVFTTSVGMEMAARGIPVITAGKSHYRGYGFTHDPSSSEEYFNTIDTILSAQKKINKDKMIDLAMKFIKFNFFHYYSKTGLLKFNFGKNTNIEIDTLKELKKGNNKHFDYIVDCIEQGNEILSKNRWMEES